MTRWLRTRATPALLAVVLILAAPIPGYAAKSSTPVVTAQLDGASCVSGGGMQVSGHALVSGGTLSFARLWADELVTVTPPYQPYDTPMHVSGWWNDDTWSRTGPVSDVRSMNTADPHTWDTHAYSPTLWTASAPTAWWAVGYIVQSAGVQASPMWYVSCVAGATAEIVTSLEPTTPWTEEVGQRVPVAATAASAPAMKSTGSTQLERSGSSTSASITLGLSNVACLSGGGLTVTASTALSSGSLALVSLVAEEIATVSPPYSAFPDPQAVSGWWSDDSWSGGGPSVDVRTLRTTDRSSWDIHRFAPKLWSSSSSDAWWWISAYARGGRSSGSLVTQVNWFVKCGTDAHMVTSLTPTAPWIQETGLR